MGTVSRHFLCALVVLVVLCMMTFIVGADSTAAYVVRRNVRDYGAVGDGLHDDTDAFIAALTQGKATSVLDPSHSTAWNASQYNCQTTRPSIVNVPPGRYLISSMLPLTYYTQLVGSHYPTRPTLVFVGTQYYCMDAGNDEGMGIGWYGNVVQNNFFHQVRNFIVDLTGCSHCSALNWQISQATNIVNVDLLLGDPVAQNNTGVLIWDGSGGYFGDLRITGGSVALSMGNQQFTIRNVTIENANVAVLLTWDWVWAFHDIRVTNASIGFQLSGGVASVSLVDVVITDTDVGVWVMNASATQFLLDGVNMSQSVAKPLVLDNNGTQHRVIVTNPQDVFVYASARQLDGSMRRGATSFSFDRPADLLDPIGGRQKWFGRTRPNYESFTTANLTNWTDVTVALQALLLSTAGATPLFVPYGTYFISDTVVLPVGTKMFGEAWTRFAPIGPKFANASNPQPMFQVGTPATAASSLFSSNAEGGAVEISDLLLTSHYPAPGAELLVWYASCGDVPGACGLWDVHFRIGGAVGTEMNGTVCMNNETTFLLNGSACYGVHTLFRIAPNASVYVENVWGWVADHDLDSGTSLSIYSARGLIVETTKAVWLYGTAMEHSFLFQYNLVRSANTFLSIIQTETPYMQPEAGLDLSLLADSESDPRYSATQMHAYSIFATAVAETVLYGAGMYSFFFHWHNTCGDYCQGRISAWTTESWGTAASPLLPTVRLHNYNTHAASIVLEWNLVDVPALNMSNGFCDTVSVW